MSSLTVTLRLVQEIAKLVRAKLPLEPALQELAARAPQPLRKVADEVSTELAKGGSLRRALATDDRQATKMLAAAIELGESSSQLDVSLESWAQFVLSGHQHKSRMVTALLYPAALTVIAIGSLVFCVYTLVPHYDEAFRLLTDFRPDWLAWVTWVRRNIIYFTIGLAIAMVLPITWTVFRRTRRSRSGLPTDPALRFYSQAHAARLASVGVHSGRPVNQLLPCLLASPDLPGTSLNQGAAEFIGKETSTVLASLETNSVSHTDALDLLKTLATQLQLAGDFASQRDARWLPTLVSLVIGLLVGVCYVLLIYLPWIVLFCYMSSSTLS